MNPVTLLLGNVLLDDLHFTTNIIGGLSWLMLFGLSIAFAKQYAQRSIIFTWIRPVTLSFEIFFLVSGVRALLIAMHTIFPKLGMMLGVVYIINDICLGIACGYASVYYRRGPRFLERLARHQLNSRRLDSLQDILPDGVIEFDKYGIIWYANPAMAKIFGYEKREEILGTELRDHLPLRYRKTLPEQMEMLLKSTDPIRGHGWRHGAEFPIEVTVASYSFSNQTRYCAVIRDITYRTKLENQVSAHAL